MRPARPRPTPTLLLAGAAALLGLLGLGCKGRGDPARAAGGKVSVTADANGFTPSSIQVEKGAPLELVFTRKSDDTCATSVVLPELAVTKDLPLNTPVSIVVPTTAARTLSFQCGMGMYKSKIVIQ